MGYRAMEIGERKGMRNAGSRPPLAGRRGRSGKQTLTCTPFQKQRPTSPAANSRAKRVVHNGMIFGRLRKK